MAVTDGEPHIGDVPTVRPEQLRDAVGMIYSWVEDGDDMEGDQTMPGEDLCDLLDRMTRTINVEPDVAIALFKRALALSAFCGEADVPETLFENDLPGRELCTAAARAQVLDAPGEIEGEITHYFDEAAMHAALLAARN